MWWEPGRKKQEVSTKKKMLLLVWNFPVTLYLITINVWYWRAEQNFLWLILSSQIWIHTVTVCLVSIWGQSMHRLHNGSEMSLKIGSCGFLKAFPVTKQTNKHIKNCTWNITLQILCHSHDRKTWATRFMPTGSRTMISRHGNYLAISCDQ